jgi:hypothetical protein
MGNGVQHVFAKGGFFNCQVVDFSYGGSKILGRLPKDAGYMILRLIWGSTIDGMRQLVPCTGAS